MKEIIKIKDKLHLVDAIKQEIKLNGANCDLNHLDVSEVTDMSELFLKSKFNGNISGWNTSSVPNMRAMFYNSLFKRESRVTNMTRMFAGSRFNGDISGWNTSNVIKMVYMFSESKFNGNISRWDASCVEDMSCMFTASQFNGDISGWEISKVDYIEQMFEDCPAPRPYWSKYEDIKRRKIVIQEYQNRLREKQELQNTLFEPNIKPSNCKV